ncbi:MAG: MMPL family transporter [Spirochaetia bacterium]|nr:MMPL family transporter [Spirochaetia bacterium]
MGFFAAGITMDSNIHNLVPEDDGVKRILEQHGFEDGTYRMLILAIEGDKKDVFDLEGLQMFERVIHEIEALDGIDESINPFNSISFKKDGSRLVVSTAGPEGRAPRDHTELEAYIRTFTGDPTLTGSVRSEDSLMISACFYCSGVDDTQLFMQRFNSLIEPLKQYYTVYSSGDYVFTARTETYMSKDLSILLVLSSLCILLFFYLGFRSLRAVILPFLSVMIGMIWSLGLMVIFGIELTIIGIMMPPLVITLGTSYSIHLLNEYYRCLPEKVTDGRWIILGVRRISGTILLASLTTAAGFLSLLTTSLSQTRDFGLASAFGIISCALLSLFFLPAVLQLLPAPASAHASAVRSGPLTQFMGRLAERIFSARYLILGILVCILVTFLIVNPNMTHQSDYLNYFPKKEPMVQDLIYLTERLGSFQPVNITLKAPGDQKDYFLREDIVQNVSQFEQELLSDPSVQAVRSYTSYLEDINQIMTGERGLPESRGLTMVVSRFFKLFDQQTTDAMAKTLINQDYSEITINCQVRNPETGLLVNDQAFFDLYTYMHATIEEYLPAEIGHEVWCNALIYLNLSTIMDKDQVMSVLISMLCIFLITFGIFRVFRYSLLILVPLAFGLMMNTIVMVAFGIPRDMITLMVSSVAIGVGVDDAIHFMLQYIKQRSMQEHDIRSALVATLRMTGRPILLTTVSIFAGMMVLTAAAFKGIAVFGLLVSVALVSTMVGTLIFLPALLAVFGSAKDRRLIHDPETGV